MNIYESVLEQVVVHDELQTYHNGMEQGVEEGTITEYQFQDWLDSDEYEELEYLNNLMEN